MGDRLAGRCDRRCNDAARPPVSGTDCDCSNPGAGDNVGGDKETLDVQRRPLVGESTTLGANVERGMAAAVVSGTVGGCRGLACSLLLVGNFVTSSAIAKASVALASSRSRGSARSLGYLSQRSTVGEGQQTQ